MYDLPTTAAREDKPPFDQSRYVYHVAVSWSKQPVAVAQRPSKSPPTTSPYGMDADSMALNACVSGVKYVSRKKAIEALLKLWHGGAHVDCVVFRSLS